MKKELQYFKIEEAWGGSQEWFSDRMMRLGGWTGSIEKR